MAESWEAWGRVQTLPTTHLYSVHVGAGRRLARPVSQRPGHQNWKAPSLNADGSFYSQQEGKEGNETATLHWSPPSPGWKKLSHTPLSLLTVLLPILVPLGRSFGYMNGHFIHYVLQQPGSTIFSSLKNKFACSLFEPVPPVAKIRYLNQ